MPTYQVAPLPQKLAPKRLIPGTPEYLYGSFNRLVSPTKLLVTAVAATSTVLTFSVTVNEGNIPAVGSLLTVINTVTNSQFNVTNAIIASVTIGSAGTGTITVGGTGFTVVSTTADSGQGWVPQLELGDTVANGSSIAVAMPANVPFSADNVADALQVEISFPTLPTACTVNLQGALFDNDADYVNINVVATVASSTPTLGQLSFSAKYIFYRFHITGTSGSGTIVAKLHG